MMPRIRLAILTLALYVPAANAQQGTPPRNAPRTTGNGAAAAPARNGTAAPANSARTTTPAPANPAAGKAQPPKADLGGLPPKRKPTAEGIRKMDQLLARWETQSKQVKALTATYTRVDHSLLFDVKKHYEGQAQLKSPDFVYLDFYDVVTGKPKGAFSERIVCDGKNVYQFFGSTKQIFVFTLDQNVQQKALNEGPLPFLFDMTAAKAKARYELSYLEESADSYMIEIRPKLDIDIAEFAVAWIKLDKERFLPMAIKLWAPNGQDTKLFTFKPDAMFTNRQVSSAWFDGPKMLNDLKADRWTVILNPGADGRPTGAPPAAAPRNGAAGAVGAKPAAKGAGVRQR